MAGTSRGGWKGQGRWARLDGEGRVGGSEAGRGQGRGAVRLSGEGGAEGRGRVKGARVGVG